VQANHSADYFSAGFSRTATILFGALPQKYYADKQDWEVSGLPFESGVEPAVAAKKRGAHAPRTRSGLRHGFQMLFFAIWSAM